jgi:DNA-binding NarL/FixJ family response regulator
MPVRIFVADDHDIVREGVKSLLKSRADWVVCGEAANGRDAIASIRELRPDVAVLDISMPGLTGLEVARQVTALNSGTKTVIFTMHDGKSLLKAAEEAGAKGLVLKSYAARDLVRALEAIIAGETFFHPEITDVRESKIPFGFGSLFMRSIADLK